MNVGFEDYPFNKFSKIGPKIFISRLIDSIKKKKLCKISPSYLPFYDVAILSILAKNYYNKPYLVRFDGLYNDKNNTAGFAPIYLTKESDCFKRKINEL